MTLRGVSCLSRTLPWLVVCFALALSMVAIILEPCLAGPCASCDSRFGIANSGKLECSQFVVAFSMAQPVAAFSYVAPVAAQHAQLAAWYVLQALALLFGSDAMPAMGSDAICLLCAGHTQNP